MTDAASAATSSRVSFGTLRAFIATAMSRLGLPDADAAAVGRLMAEADLQGSDGHGVIRLAPMRDASGPAASICGPTSAWCRSAPASSSSSA